MILGTAIRKPEKEIKPNLGKVTLITFLQMKNVIAQLGIYPTFNQSRLKVGEMFGSNTPFPVFHYYSNCFF